MSQRKHSVNKTIIIFKAEETARAWRLHLMLRGLWAGYAEVAVREREKEKRETAFMKTDMVLGALQSFSLNTETPL